MSDFDPSSETFFGPRKKTFYFSVRQSTTAADAPALAKKSFFLQADFSHVISVHANLGTMEGILREMNEDI